MKCILILTWLISHGYSQIEATGIITNLYIESKCNPNSNNGSQIGLAQWQGSRKSNLIYYSRLHNTHWTNLFLQLEFLDLEWKQITQRNPQVARRSLPIAHRQSFTIHFCQKFERPKFNCKHRERISKLRPWEKE